MILKSTLWCIKKIYLFKKKYIFLMILDAFLKGISPVVSLLLIKKITDIIQLEETSIYTLIVYLSILSIFYFFNEIITNYNSLKLKNYDLEFSSHFESIILEKISVLDTKMFEDNNIYDLIIRTQQDATISIIEQIKTIFLIFSIVLTTISYVIIIITFNRALFVIIIILPIIRFLFEKKYNIMEYTIQKETTEYSRKVNYISYLLTESENIKEIKSFGLFQYFIDMFKKINILRNRKIIELNRKKYNLFNVIEFFETFVDYAITLFILVEAYYGKLTIGSFLMYNGAIDNSKESITSLFSNISLLYKNSLAIELAISFFNIPEEVINKNGVQIQIIETIELKNVSYRYNKNNEYSLKNIYLKLSKGNFYIFMGYNGSGKSTLMKILMGIYTDYTGNILINGINLKEINLNCYRRLVSVLFQNHIKYESTVVENIQYGNIKKKISTDLFENIITKVQLNEFSNNKNQNLGYQFTDGTQISIGQWQKLALGRLLNSDSDVYILDEPNSALDLISEKKILNTIYDETIDKMMIMVIHRFNNLMLKADEIFILDSGRLIANGTHMELLKECPIYVELVYISREGY